ncbi:MAG: hypothetical protein ACI4UO_05885 [Paludibacteraceae bacterium]
MRCPGAPRPVGAEKTAYRQNDRRRYLTALRAKSTDIVVDSE